MPLFEWVILVLVFFVPWPVLIGLEYRRQAKLKELTDD